MNELLKTKLIGLLTDTLPVTNEQMGNAYGCFMEQLKTVCQSETDYSKIFRMLNNTRIELVSIKTLNWYEQGKKCPEICLSAKSISTCQC